MHLAIENPTPLKFWRHLNSTNLEPGEGVILDIPDTMPIHSASFDGFQIALTIYVPCYPMELTKDDDAIYLFTKLNTEAKLTPCFSDAKPVFRLVTGRVLKLPSVRMEGGHYIFPAYLEWSDSFRFLQSNYAANRVS